MRGKSLGLIVLLGALIGQAPLAAAGCPCPKAKMIELYGSVSMFPPKLPGPRLRQPALAQVKPAPSVSVTSVPSMAEVASTLQTPAIDQMADPLDWEPIFVQQ